MHESVNQRSTHYNTHTNESGHPIKWKCALSISWPTLSELFHNVNCPLPYFLTLQMTWALSSWPSPQKHKHLTLSFSIFLTNAWTEVARDDETSKQSGGEGRGSHTLVLDYYINAEEQVSEWCGQVTGGMVIITFLITILRQYEIHLSAPIVFHGCNI